MNLETFLQDALDARRAAHLYRERATLYSPQGAAVSAARYGQPIARDYLNFASNDYLGLAAHPALGQAATAASAQAGFGSGASHLVCGHHQLHRDLEAALAARTGREAAIVFSTGFAANMGVITALLGRGDAVLQDRLNHASLIDGARLSGADFKRFRHNDVAHLADLLAASRAARRLVAVDAVFSMDGDLAPLADLAALCQQHDAWLMADDAHGFGWLGPQGAGTCAALGLGATEVPILMGTLGKALGSYGAFVAGSRALIDYLVQFARPYIYSTAMPPAVAAATLAALDLLDSESFRREALVENIVLFRREAAARNLPLLASNTPIQPVLIGDDARVMVIAKLLDAQGFWVAPIRPPTVPAGTARLRITLSATHTRAQLIALVDALARALAATEIKTLAATQTIRPQTEEADHDL